MISRGLFAFVSRGMARGESISTVAVLLSSRGRFAGADGWSIVWNPIRIGTNLLLFSLLPVGYRCISDVHALPYKDHPSIHWGQGLWERPQHLATKKTYGELHSFNPLGNLRCTSPPERYLVAFGAQPCTSAQPPPFLASM